MSIHQTNSYKSALLADESHAYLIWGINNETHDVVGTTFEPENAKKENTDLQLWLASSLSPSIEFNFYTANHPDGRAVVLQIPAAEKVSTKFKSIAYIRIGETTPKLSDYPEREANLIGKLKPFVWEGGVALGFIDGSEVTLFINSSPCKGV